MHSMDTEDDPRGDSGEEVEGRDDLEAVGRQNVKEDSQFYDFWFLSWLRLRGGLIGNCGGGCEPGWNIK